MSKFLKPALYVIASFFIVSFAFGFGWIFGIAVMLLGFLFLAFIMRGDLLATYAQLQYNKDHGKGFLWYERAMKTGKMRPQAMLVYAYLLIRDGVLDKSERIINKTMFVYKEKLTDEYRCASHLNLSIIKWKRGQLTEAIEELEEVYATGFRSTVMYGTLGTYYLLNGQYAKALEFHKEAMEYNDTDHSIRDNMALNYYLCGNITAADEMYEELIDEEPKFLEPYYNYGMVLEHMGEYEAAMANYKTALSFEEKFLSTVKHAQVQTAIEKLEAKMSAEDGGDKE
ncbi:MAG: hypothetical protein IKB50_00535 [Clostridia bacterium]|nr:hypothetical protein [Clostridia bacterium]